ncbi:putative pyridoxamine 5-phosphate oxidase, FMN-binding [Crocosphaera subtropica ATCC 51142]|uniref:Pyridoxamine 5-phosphate oxidase, FMN-binding n=1 Tax=Crocosphaera subtropica (strain ATCC 51142 / BH68) TaxID=43989 RepID=B1WQ80_CROS5|nr:Npun_F5749 family FMN-dependent PPOX-type flavoprotein [Crocosphaera subtropica]ACB50002.1 putative pyridoxamine 5-phosphate oxidase, FMN-binding [Crocosphaera subtropica ATCC 51142]
MIDILAPWRTILSRSLHRNRSLPNARYLQLATVNLQGKPSNRTVVFRGFLNNKSQLQIITDGRSEKINHISNNAASEICWYFPKTREQFRITGTLTIIDENYDNQTARLTVWQNLSDSARQQFTWPEPGQALTYNQQDFFRETPPKDHPLANFILLLFNPEKVDHLELRGNPHQRTLYYLDENKNWIIQAVNP